MFCLEGNVDSEKQISESLLSESVKDLNEFSENTRGLCQSDSNLFETFAKSPSKKRQKWRAKPQIRHQRSLPLKIRNRSEKEKALERTTRRVKEGGKGVVRSPENKAEVESRKELRPREGSHKVRDMEFIDACKFSSEEEVGGEKECVGGGRRGESIEQKSENSCLMKKASISNLEAIKSGPVRQRPYGGVVKGAYEGGGGEVRGKVRESQLVLHLDSDFNRKSESYSDINLLKSSNKNLKRQKVNSGTPFLSLWSLFNLSKPPPIDTHSNIGRKQDTSTAFQQNIITTSLSCCALSSQETNSEFNQNRPPQQSGSIVIISKSPKPENQTLFPQARPMVPTASLRLKTPPFLSSSNSSADGTAPIASPEITSLPDSELSSAKSTDSEGHGPFRERRLASKGSLRGANVLSSISAGSAPLAAPKLNLLHEGDAQVCYLSHTTTVFRKVLSSKLLRRWETHHIYLTDDCLRSRTSTGLLESPIPYSNLDEVHMIGRWDHRNRFCIRLMMAEGSLMLQTSNSLVRDQWLSSILWKKNMHKYKNILRTSTRPEVILKEIKGLIHSSLNSPLQDDCIRSVPIEIISGVLTEDELWRNRQRAEEIIVALAPLLEDSTPTPEMLRFFSRHCLAHPRSPVIVDVFTSVVQRILKRTTDFSKSPSMRRFVADYFKALHSQNDGEEAIRKSIASLHGNSFGCPHPRVVTNLVAVILAAVFSHYEQRIALLTESANETNCNEALQLLDKQLECFVTLFVAISEYEDWRCGLAQLLQPIPLPDDALSHPTFIKEFIPVMRKIGTDPRCEVHQTLLGIRESKEGWLNVFCPSSLVCKDEGELWCEMLETLFNCCCRRKSFLQKMVKRLGALQLVALRDHEVAQEMLCLMLEWRLINGEDQKMQVVTTLQSNKSGRRKYNELCKREEQLRELQKEGGPVKLTLPSRSTDADVARLLSCGSFGNLECLSLAFTHVTSACAHQLILLPALRNLNLWATQFGDAGLVIIAEHLDKLQVLNLCETPVSDKGIVAIAGMRSLKKLNLNSTKLSPQTLDTLKLKLPTLEELDVRYTDAW